MEIFRRIVLAALLAGLISGVVVAVAHYYTTVPLIQKAETYPEPPGAEPSPAGWHPAEGFERTASTTLADVVTAFASALLLVAFYAIYHHDIDWLRGLHWGLGAFATLTLWPNLGMPPYVPGQAMAPQDRQIWWTITAIAAIGGLLLLMRSRKIVLAVAGFLLLVLPHIFGAPLPASYNSAIPESLAHQFVVASVMTNLLFWLLLGSLTGFFYSRFVSGRAADAN